MFFKLLFCAILYSFWIKSQNYLATDLSADGRIIDRIHESYYVNEINQYLHEHPNITNFHLALSTFLIDINIIIVFAICIFGYKIDEKKRFRPVFLTFMGVIWRQICQFNNKLPIPNGIIWHDPGVYTIFMVYDAVNDFFFSGHTLISLIMGTALYDFTNRYSVKIYSIIFIIYEIGFVIVTKSHYSMDVEMAIASFGALNYIYAALGRLE